MASFEAGSLCGSLAESTHCDLAIVGAGVSGCALAARLRQRGWGGSITLLEIGRGPGGRAATRRSRQQPELSINHGTPLFNLRRPDDLALLAALIDGGWIEPFEGAICSLEDDGSLGPLLNDPLLSGQLWQGSGGAMEHLSQGLLALAKAGPGQTTLKTGTLVRWIEPKPNGEGLLWLLKDSSTALLVEAPMLVLSGTLLAHPRSSQLLGWDQIPLQLAAQQLQDPQLLQAATALAAMEAQASLNLLLHLPPPEARLWLDQPWRLLQLGKKAQQRWSLRRVSIQPNADGSCGVVAESTAELAAKHQGVVGNASSAATRLGVRSDRALEEAVIDQMTARLQQALGLSADGSKQLMRWGAAFPVGQGLDPALSLCSRSRIGFCGDAIAGLGFGRVEGALSSAITLADRLVDGDDTTGCLLQ